MDQPIRLFDWVLGDVVPEVGLQHQRALRGNFQALLAGDGREHFCTAGIDACVQPHYHRAAPGRFEFLGVNMVAPGADIRSKHRVKYFHCRDPPEYASTGLTIRTNSRKTSQECAFIHTLLDSIIITFGLPPYLSPNFGNFLFLLRQVLILLHLLVMRRFDYLNTLNGLPVISVWNWVHLNSGAAESGVSETGA